MKVHTPAGLSAEFEIYPPLVTIEMSRINTRSMDQQEQRPGLTRHATKEVGMDVVLVSWSIRADAVDQFKDDFKEMKPADTPGLIREDLYRLEDPPEDGSVHFLRVGRWDSQDAFYKALAGIAAPGMKPKPKPYERGDRRREWLIWARDDIPTGANSG
jgi:hypothetical protein